MTFAVVIIIAVYLPILFLQGLEGRMFRPMAITVCAALFGSLLLALTMVPALASFAFRKGIPRGARARAAHRWMDASPTVYARALAWAMEHRASTVGCGRVVLAVALGSLFFIGTEFMPKLDEGSILVETRKLPGVSLTDSIEISKRIEQRLRTFPEIADVVIKIGRPDFATEAMGINEGDTYLLLKPMDTVDAISHQGSADRGRRQGPVRHSRHRLQLHAAHGDADRRDHLRREGRSGDQGVRRRFPHAGHDWRSRCCGRSRSVRGAADAQMEITSGVAELSVRVDRAALARYGLNVSDVEEAVAAGGSGDVISRGHRRPEAIHRRAAIARALSHGSDAMRSILLRAPGGEQVTSGPSGECGRDARPREDRARGGPAAHRGHVQRAGPRSGQLRRRGAREARARRQRCRPAISSNMAASLRTRSARRDG